MHHTNNFNSKIYIAILSALASSPAQSENKAEAIEMGTIEVVNSTPLDGLGVPVPLGKIL